jgi:hypothetical protein
MPYYNSMTYYLAHRHPKEAMSYMSLYFQSIPYIEMFHISKMAKTQNAAIHLAQYMLYKQTGAEGEFKSKRM